MVSAVKLEAIKQAEKENGEILQLEHIAYTPAPPCPKREGNEEMMHQSTTRKGRMCIA